MCEIKPFGKRTGNRKKLPDDEVLKKTFAIVNNGCDSKQVINFIERTTGHRFKETEENDR